MDFKKWEDVVVSWVNCLRLSDPIKNLKDLKNGFFFTELIKILKSTDLECTDIGITQSHILKLLDTQYPNFTLDSENFKELEDLSEPDLLALASLLLHFSCVLDRRDVLTSPLCHQLPKKVQIQIRNFLESMKKDITKTEFFQLIEKCVEKPQLRESLSRYRSQSNDLNAQSRSPLQELLLQTPIKHRSLAKDREIKKLRSEIELEQFEKADLQDELKSQQNKNIKLNKQVANKSAEIMRLRSEIANLEAQTVPTYADQESAELQRRLRGEILSLEQYVAKLQNELCELYNEKDLTVEKLRKVEGQCSIWQEKATSTEQDFDNLIEQHRQKEIELNCLRCQCNELSALLEELQASRRSNESCTEEDANSIQNSQLCEDLACAVVEVQLRDVKKENIQLINTLKISQENALKLEEELSEVKQRFSNLEADYHAMQIDNDDLIVKVSTLTETQSTLFKTREELEHTLKKVTQLSLDNSSLTENLNLLHEKVSDTNASLVNIEAANQFLCNEIESLHSKNKSLFEDKSKKTEEYDELETQMVSLQSKYDTLVNKYNETDFNLQSATLNLEKLDTEVEHNLKNLTTLVSGLNDLDLSDNNKAFETIFQKLLSNDAQQLGEKNVLMNRIDCFEQLNAELKNDLTALEEKQALSLQERRQLHNDLSNAESKLLLLENTIAQHVLRIEELNTTIAEMSGTINELEMLKETIEQKQCIIVDLEHVNHALQIKLKLSNEELNESRSTQNDLKTRLEDLEHIKTDFEKKVEEVNNQLSNQLENTDKNNREIAELRALNNLFECEISETSEKLANCKINEGNLLRTVSDLEISKVSLERQLMDANTKIDHEKSRRGVLEHELFEREKQHQINIRDMNVEIEGYIRKIEELELDLQSSKFGCATAEKDLKLLQNIKEELLHQIELCKSDFTKRIAVVEATKEKLQGDLKNAVQDALSIQDQLLEKSNEYHELVTLRDKNDEELSKVQSELLECKKNMTELHESCTKKDDLLSKSTQDLLFVKLDAEIKSEHIANLEKNLTERNLRIEELECEISFMNEQNEDLRTKTTELENESTILENIRNSLENKCSELENHGWKVVNELTSKNEQLEDLLGKYNKYQEITQTKLNSLEDALAQSKSELEELFDTKNKMGCEKNIEIKNIQYQIEELNVVIDSFNIREIEYIEEVNKLKCELSDSITKYTEALQVHQELETDNDCQINNLTENLHNMVEKYNTLNESYCDTVQQLQNVQEHLNDLENTKIELEVKAMKQKHQFEEDYNKCVFDLNLQIQEKAEHEAALISEVQEVVRQLEMSDKYYNDLKIDMSEMCMELSKLKKDKENLYHNLRKFKTAYQDLKDMYSSLKISHLEFVNSNTNSLQLLKVDLVDHINLLLTKNVNLNSIIEELNKQIKYLTTEHEAIQTAHTEKFSIKDEEIQTLRRNNVIHQENMNKVVQNKEMLEEQLVEERLKVNHLRETETANSEKIEECLRNILQIKCINDVLETEKAALQKEMLCKAEKLEELEKLQCEEQRKYEDEIIVKNAEIGALTDKVETLEKQLAQNTSTNGDLMLEICNINHTLENLTKQHTSLQEVLIEERAGNTKRLQQVESDLSDRQTLLQNLQTENDFVTQEVALAKDEIAELKNQIKTIVTERQVVELQLKYAKEKVKDHDIVAFKQESVISELNTKLVQKLEEMLTLENAKILVEQNLEKLTLELSNIKKNRDEMFESQAKIIKETENHLIRAHQNAIDVKDNLMARIDILECNNIKDTQLRADLEKLLEGEKIAKEILEIRVLELTNEKIMFSQLLSGIKHNIGLLSGAISEKPVEITFNDGEVQGLNMNDLDSLNKNIEMVQNRIISLIKQNENSINEIEELQTEKTFLTCRVEGLLQEQQLTLQEKQQLFENYNILCQEKMERECDLKSFNDIQLEHNQLKVKYDQLVLYNKSNEAFKTKNDELVEQIQNLERKTTEIYNIHKKYAGYSNSYKVGIEKLISERCVLEKILISLRQVLLSIQVKLSNINEGYENVRLTEQMRSFEIILEDIQKQFLRSSRKIHEYILISVQIPVTMCDSIESHNVALEQNIKNINFDDEYDAILDCKDCANDLLEQMTTFDGTLGLKNIKVQKQRSSNTVNTDVKPTDDEVKKRNVVLKQRLTLAENAKNNLEKKIKQLRQENKTLSESSVSCDGDIGYKTLLRQHIESKEQFEKNIHDSKIQYNKLLQEFKDYKTKYQFIPDEIKHVKDLKTEHDVKLEGEVYKLREAYGNVMSDNSRLDLENATMRRLLEDRTSQLSELRLIKEAYEKLLEENNKLNMELDTLKYKRHKDREALFEALKSARSENKKITEVRNEYEGKLEKMKTKMIQLYKEEIDKEMQKHQSDQTEKVTLLKTIELLKQNLKSLQLESGNYKSADSQNSDISVASSSSFFLNCSEVQSVRSSSTDFTSSRNRLARKITDDRRYTTLPKQMSAIQENYVSKSGSLNYVPKHLAPGGQVVEMEDEEGDLFNNKYLADLKEGRCIVPNGRESNINRYSELQWRNSFCPPHLKSSYPAETQFHSPGPFKEEDIKLGAGGDFNDSLSTRLLPSDKPRKKDFGTTSYKKPGPPTPSKNGGRASLQSNELRDVLHDCNESKTPKRITPNRLKQLFLGKGNMSSKENNESQPTTPRSKRLSIFRKPK